MSPYFRLKNPDDVTESQALAATWRGFKEGMAYLLYFAYIQGANSRWENMALRTDMPRIIASGLAREDDTIEAVEIYGYFVGGEFQQGIPAGATLTKIDEEGTHHMDFSAEIDGIVVMVDRKPLPVQYREDWKWVSQDTYCKIGTQGPFVKADCVPME